VILDAPAWVVAMHNSKNVVVRNVKEICARENSDGVDICNSQDVLVEDCFLRNNDDEVCVKTVSPPPASESKNIVVRRVVVWNDRARGLGITSETRANIAHVLFQDCDIIHDLSAGGDCAALAVLVSDSGTMSDIRFEDIRCEDVRNTLVNCWIGADMWGHDKTRGHIKGVTFKDIRVTGSTFPVSKLTGFDEAHVVEDVTFEHLQIQGKPIGDAQAARLQIGAHVRGVKFLP
jgi:polygalacturonase